MYRIYVTVIEMLAAGLLIVPIFGVYGKLWFHSTKNTVIYTIVAFYLAAILSLVGFPNLYSLMVDVTINFVPVVGIVSDLKNAVLNIILFVPLGIFLPLLWERYRELKQIVKVGLLGSCVIEVAQIFTFRTTDVNDLITNTFGAVCGYILVNYVSKNFSKHSCFKTQLRDFYLIAGTVLVIMFFAQPLVSHRLWELML